MALHPLKTRIAPGAVCAFGPCEEAQAAVGLCRTHRRQQRQGKTLTMPRTPKHRTVGKDGYVSIKTGDGWRLEHRVVMERVLGRPLLPGETVHHKNGARGDNRPTNLELWVSHQPAGQRPEDLLEWADEIVRRYRPDTLDHVRLGAGNLPRRHA